MLKAIQKCRPQRLFLLLLLAGFVPSLAAAEDSPWTTKPVRIDRSAQDYERLPAAERQKKKVEEAEKRFVLRLPAQITIQDGATFSARGKTYVLDGIEPVAADKICTSDVGSHWPCGRSSAMFSGKLLRRQLLQCASALHTDDETRLTGCKIGSRNVQAEIVMNGQAFAAPGEDTLAGLMEKARQARKGVWRDEACFEGDDDCRSTVHPE